jgi:hypothetical protein
MATLYLTYPLVRLSERRLLLDQGNGGMQFG